MRRAKLRNSAAGLAIVVAMIALLMKMLSGPLGGWRDLMAGADLTRHGDRRGVRHWVERPGQKPLVITVAKLASGVHSRGWEITIAEASDDKVESVKKLSWPLGEWYPEETGTRLASFSTSQSVEDDISEYLSTPSFWYRRTADGVQVLARQPDSAWNSAFDFQEGYYTWTPGDCWRMSDRWGTKGAPAKYIFAKTVARDF